MIICDCKQAKHVHGSHLMYRAHKCRCEPCETAAAEDNRRYRERGAKMVSAEPSQDLVNALLADGYVAQWLSVRIAGNKSYVQALMRARSIPEPRANRIQALYEELMDVEGVNPELPCGHAIGSGGWVKDHMGISRYRCKECATELMGVAA